MPDQVKATGSSIRAWQDFESRLTAHGFGSKELTRIVNTKIAHLKRDLAIYKSYQKTYFDGQIFYKKRRARS